jgi:hypothetical protein
MYTPLMTPPKKTRDHTSKHSLSHSSRQLRRVSESIAKKMGRFAEGQWLVLVGSMCSDDRTGTVSKQWRVVGDDPTLVATVKHAMPGLEAQLAMKHHYTNDTAHPLHELLVMPGNAEKRARKLRKLLAYAWKEHTIHTAFEGTKQMYAVVKNHPHMLFEWWNEVTDNAPFVNTAVDDPEVSEKVYAYLAPRLAARSIC